MGFAYFMLGWINRVKTGTLTAGSADASLPITNLAVDPGSPAMAWQTIPGTRSSWFAINTGIGGSIWRAFGLFLTNLTSAATVRWRVGPDDALIERTPLVDLRYSAGAITPPAGYNFARASTGNTFDVTGTLVSVAANTLRYWYDPTSHAFLGALKEEARTNGIRNPRGEGGTPGSPGTAPANVQLVNGTGLTATFVGTGTENGIPYIEYRLFGTTTASSNFWLTWETATGIPAAPGQVWTASAYVRINAGSTAGATNMGIDIVENNSGGTQVLASTFNLVFASTPLGTSRPSASMTLAQPTTAFIRPRIRFTVPTATVFDFNFRFSPQCEQGYLASSLILPAIGTPAATTRAADREWVTGLSLGTGITLHADFTATGDAAGAFVPISLSPASALFVDSLYIVGNRGASNMTFILKDSAHGDAATQPSKALVEGIPCRVTGAVNAVRMEFTLNALANQHVVAANTYAANFAILGCGGASWGATPGTAQGVAIYRRLALYGTPAMTAGQVVALCTTGSSMDATAVTYDSGVLAAGVAANYGQHVHVAPADQTGQVARCDIDDATNPDGFLNVPLAYAGPVWQGTGNISGQTTFGRDDNAAEVASRAGQEYPVVSVQSRRRAEIAWSSIRDAEVLPSVEALDFAARASGNVLFLPNPASTTVNQEAIFGRFRSTGDIGMTFGVQDRRSWRARITERL